MQYQVEIQSIQTRATAVVRLRAGIEELPVVIPRACGEVWNFGRANGLTGMGRHLALYLDDVMNIEVGVEIAQPFPGDDRVVCSSLPAGRVATTAHIGPYHLLGDAHSAVKKWCSANGHKLAGPSWEIYGHWTDDPTKLRTDVYWLLRPAAAASA
jgi:effector-binding domain-containing protein